MAYSTLDDLKLDVPERDLISLTDDAGLKEIDQTKYEAARDDADALIDGYLVGGGYTVPLSPVPAIVNRLSRGITLYFLYLRQKRESMSESMQKEHASDLRVLEQIQGGRIVLGTVPRGVSQGSYKTNKATGDRVFGKDTLDQY